MSSKSRWANLVLNGKERKMGQDKTGYVRDRMLIEAARILSPQFNALGVYLTGAQVELLRNAVNVLDKPTTFVDEYKLGYYTTPTDNDWDAICSIVADLERKLMGNDNTIFAYNDRVLAFHTNSSHAPGLQVLETMPVPAGYVHVIQHASIWQAVTAGGLQEISVQNNGQSVRLGTWSNVSAGIVHPLPLEVVLKEDDSIKGTWTATASDEYLELAVWGYKMKVPE